MASTSRTPQLTGSGLDLEPSQPSTMQASWSARLIGPLEEMEWLEKAQQKVTGWLQPLLEHPAAPRVLDFLHGRWLGHALHPVLTDLPIGMWSSSLLLDLVGARKSAGVLSAAGSAAAVGAAATGVADWSVTDGRERRLALLHGSLNLAGLLLQLGSLSARLRRRRSRAFTLSCLGWGVSTAAAYLGGELVFSRGLMVDHNAWQAGPNDWTRVLPAADLPAGETRAVEVEGRKLLLYRDRRTVHALEDRCSHAGGPLSEGAVEDGIVTCPWHGSQFRLTDGAACRGPAVFAQPRLQARVIDGQIEIRGRNG